MAGLEGEGGCALMSASPPLWEGKWFFGKCQRRRREIILGCGGAFDELTLDVKQKGADLDCLTILTL